ncbi:MAG: glycosyltransferase family 2 protein [Symploca sp. SIO1C2]|nr:glycosyltransferase family 2 protein [Symploca sp. SIO1C2]
MNQKPLISGIMIFFNPGKFIEEAIASVVDQTYDNWELLLVDDGSSDESTAIALEYAQKYPDKIRYLEHEGHQNRGMSATRNLGIRNAQGEYLAFLDSDDVWFPRKLEEQLAILEAHPSAALVFGPVQWWYSWTGEPEDLQRDFVTTFSFQPDILMQPPKFMARLLKKPTVTIVNSLVRRQVLDDAGGFEESFHGMFEDQAIFAKICLNKPIFIASACWYKWRQHPSSCCAVAAAGKEKHDQERLVFFEWLEEYMAQQGIKDGEVRRALGERLLPYRNPFLNRMLGRTRRLMYYLQELWKWTLRWTLPVFVRD